MRYGATTRLSPERALEKAKDFFGKLEMALEEESPKHLLLKGDSGYVQITVNEMHGTELDIDTKGFDQSVKQFLQRVG
ncbi:MAG: hypothetical protein MIO90_04975 [Methanomassiliicoccales archaeon]|nr:hypothetical protein [Methanomassiliicoccales archaeon]